MIWALSTGDDIFVRSYRGASAVWCRAIRARPRATLHVLGDALAVAAIPAADCDSIRALQCRAAPREYRGRSLEAMLQPALLGTTLGLEPPDAAA